LRHTRAATRRSRPASPAPRRWSIPADQPNSPRRRQAATDDRSHRASARHPGEAVTRWHRVQGRATADQAARHPLIVRATQKRLPRCLIRLLHVFVIASGHCRLCTPLKDMTQRREKPQTDHAGAIARSNDQRGASKSSPGKTRDSSGISTSWFVPPIVVPAFLAALIIFSVIYQHSWHVLG
jgi:hypothetical protein